MSGVAWHGGTHGFLILLVEEISYDTLSKARLKQSIHISQTNSFDFDQSIIDHIYITEAN